jgi:hypothetical protein
MKKGMAAFISGIGVSLLAAYAARGIRRQRQAEGLNLIDLNDGSMSDFRKLGLDDQMAERIFESRPYRSKLELVSRVMLPNDVYSSIKDRVKVHDTQEPVKVAS